MSLDIFSAPKLYDENPCIVILSRIEAGDGGTIRGDVSLPRRVETHNLLSESKPLLPHVGLRSWLQIANKLLQKARMTTGRPRTLVY